jgi:hypothetical protein
LVTYCYNNNHLFNIKDHGKSKQHLLSDPLWDLFRDMNQYAQLVASKPYEEQVSVRVPYLKVFGKLDIKFVDGTIMETKACQKLLSLPNIIQLMIYALSDATQYRDFVSRPIIMYNFLSGEVVNLRFNVQESSIMHIFTILSQASNQPLQRLKCIAHVEGAMGTTQPLFFSLKDYKYNYHLVNNAYIKSKEPLSIATTMLTGITDADVATGMELDALRNLLHSFFAQLSPTCTFIGYGDMVRKKITMQTSGLAPDDIEFIDGKTITEVYGNQIHLTLGKAAKLFLQKDLSHPMLCTVDVTHELLQFLNYR